MSNSLENAINELDIENRYNSVMQKIELMNTRERISVPEASGKTESRTKSSDVRPAPAKTTEIKR